MSPPRAVSLAAALAAAACAPRAQRFEEVSPPEALIEVLPRSAQLEIDGVSVGAGGRTLPVRGPPGPRRIAARAPGFEPGEVEVPSEKLAGARVGIVLRPEGFGTARRLEFDEPSGLTAAAAMLLRAGRAEQAVEFASRAVELAPEAPAPRRVLGDAWVRLGHRTRAIKEYGTYLEFAPADAPDRRDVERRIGDLRGDIGLTPGAR